MHTSREGLGSVRIAYSSNLYAWMVRMQTSAYRGALLSLLGLACASAPRARKPSEGQQVVAAVSEVIIRIGRSNALGEGRRGPLLVDVASFTERRRTSGRVSVTVSDVRNGIHERFRELPEAQALLRDPATNNFYVAGNGLFVRLDSLRGDPARTDRLHAYASSFTTLRRAERSAFCRDEVHIELSQTTGRWVSRQWEILGAC